MRLAAVYEALFRALATPRRTRNLISCVDRAWARHAFSTDRQRALLSLTDVELYPESNSSIKGPGDGVVQTSDNRRTVRSGPNGF